ncbi:hypothetical protein FA15DRAFT_664650 [Coprinopsis marcescibilis]|uniref:TPR-like protein n=1 Tax=Coprinopsis marcescibilis TaxID=230819 RepID=A0A5C3L7L9_COPMA|nr:hypothetical protein FA15DRAFT_664650 [Coprinopsis marcescibilis]
MVSQAMPPTIARRPLLYSAIWPSVIPFHSCLCWHLPSKDLQSTYRHAVGLLTQSMLDKKLQTSTENWSKQPQNNSQKDFLSTISDLAIDLRACGQHEKAIWVTEDRIAVLRGVAALMDPTKFEPLLGEALHGHAVCLDLCGRNTDALEPGQEALEIRHRLALSNPQLFNTDLATTLHSVVCDLNACDLQIDALPYLGGLITVRRKSAEQDPDKHEYPLHGLLYHYATQLAEFGRYFEAKEKSKEAVEVARRLADKDASLVTELANALSQYSCYLWPRPGLEAEAIKPGLECIIVRRRLVEAYPRGNFTLANALYNAAKAFTVCDRYEEAIPLAQEGIEIYWEIVSEDPTQFPEQAAAQLYWTYAAALGCVGRDEEAVAALKETLGICESGTDGSGRYLDDTHQVADDLLKELMVV